MAIYWHATLKRMGKLQINFLSPSHFGMVFAKLGKTNFGKCFYVAIILMAIVGYYINDY